MTDKALSGKLSCTRTGLVFIIVFFIACPTLVAPTFGDVTVYGYLDGDTGGYSCDRGYRLSPIGDGDIGCNSGSWSDTYDCVEISMIS